VDIQKSQERNFILNNLSTSFTLGKAGAINGANVEHNNRDFIAANVDTNRIADNITYTRIDVREAYRDLFGEALETYNAKQTRNDRKIDDYYEHIANGRREEAFYEIIVQFGDGKNCPVGSQGGELAKRLLDEYMRGFAQRNPNLFVFNSVMHLDEVSPHLHINVIPFYTRERKNGLSTGVSMRAALEEQGFTNKHKKENSLVEWEDSELKIMEQILKRHGLGREVKNALYAHMSVDEYKESQDEQKIVATQSWNAENAVAKLRHENATLKVENQKLTTEKHSAWKGFYYSVPEKQSYVMERLSELQIPFRETESGFEAQDIHTAQIRKLEKQFKPSNNSHREVLRDLLDNDENLDRLAELNKRINAGATLTSLRNEFAALDKSVAEKESKLAELKSELAFFRDLHSKGERCFKFYDENESDLAFLVKHKVTADNYERIMQLITANESEIAELEKSLPDERAKLRESSDTLTEMEKIAAGTYVQSLIEEHKPRLQSEFVRNGLKRVD